MLRLLLIEHRPSDPAATIRGLREAIHHAEAGHAEDSHVLGWAGLAEAYATAGDADGLTEAVQHASSLLDGLGRPRSVRVGDERVPQRRRGQRARTSGCHGGNHGCVDDESVIARLERVDAASGPRRPGQSALDEIRR